MDCCKLTEKPQADLQANRLGQIPAWMGQLLRHMGDGIRGADGEGAVEHAAQERNTPGPSGQVVLGERAPDEPRRGVGFGHGHKHGDGDDASGQDEEHAGVLRVRQQAIGEDDAGGAQPGDQDVGDVGVPRLEDKARMVGRVHLDGDVGGDLDQRGQVEHPPEEVDPSREESHHATPFGPGGDGGPVVDSSG